MYIYITLTRSLTHSLTHPPTHALTHSLTYTKEVLYLRWNEHHLRAYFETLRTLLLS